MGNEPLEANAKGQNVKDRKVNQRRNAKGWKVNRRRNTKGRISATVWISVTKMGLSATKWAYQWRNGLIGDGIGLSVTKWAYRQRFLFWFGFETVANSYRRQLPEPSRMVQRLGLGLDRHEWLSAMVWVLFGNDVGSNRQQFGFF